MHTSMTDDMAHMLVRRHVATFKGSMWHTIGTHISNIRGVFVLNALN